MWLPQVFKWRTWELKTVKEHVRDITAGHPRLAAFEKPAKGTSMAQFKDMVTSFIDSKLGSGDHNSLIDKIMNTADVDRDEKVKHLPIYNVFSYLNLYMWFLSIKTVISQKTFPVTCCKVMMENISRIFHIYNHYSYGSCQ